MRADEDPSATECDEGGDAPCWAHLFEVDDCEPDAVVDDVVDHDVAGSSTSSDVLLGDCLSPATDAEQSHAFGSPMSGRS